MPARNGEDVAASDGVVLFGGGGDLALRMLFPALCLLEMDGLLPPGVPVFALGRSPISDEVFRAKVRAVLEARAEPAIATGAAERLLSRTHYISLDVTDPDQFERLIAALSQAGVSAPLFYLAVSPSLYAQITGALGAAGLAGPAARLVVEKPLGRDLASSRDINQTLSAAFREDQIFRIDHYLGKETVQNLIALRFANALFEPLWNGQLIDHVQITVAETEGVGERWPYYDEYGALRDMVQNHMLQLLCLVAMEPPSDMDPESIRNEKVKVLRSLRPFAGAAGEARIVRGQYGRGVSEGETAASYAEERGGQSAVETFVALEARIDNWRWAGVPFFLRTGKRLAERTTEILIQFKAVPHSIFQGRGARLRPNQLLIRLQPEEDIVLSLMNQTPGISVEGGGLESLPLSLSLRPSGADRRRIAYERLILDAMRGNSTHFVRRDEIELAWGWVDGVGEQIRRDPGGPTTYSAGSWGPSGAFALLERSGRSWRDGAAACR